MQTSGNKAKSSRRPGSPLPAWHRWLGGLTVAFVLSLSITGIALNHGAALRLDARHIDWPWLLNLYGIDPPTITTSYSDGRHRATLLDGRLYLHQQLISETEAALAGLVQQDGILVVATSDRVLLFTPSGERIDAIDLGDQLGGPIQSIGLYQDRAVIRTEREAFIADASLAQFGPLAVGSDIEVQWVQASDVETSLAEALQRDAIGRGLTLERVLIDMHSGRIAGPVGVWLMDIAALALIFLSISGLVLWWRRQKLAAQLGR